MTKERLNKPFTSFDSIDERMERVPLDLRDDMIREEYLANHIKWFLQHHNGSVDKFTESVEEALGSFNGNASNSRATAELPLQTGLM